MCHLGFCLPAGLGGRAAVHLRIPVVRLWVHGWRAVQGLLVHSWCREAARPESGTARAGEEVPPVLSGAVVSPLRLRGSSWTLPGPLGTVWPWRNGSARDQTSVPGARRQVVAEAPWVCAAALELWPGGHRLLLGLPTSGSPAPSCEGRDQFTLVSLGQPPLSQTCFSISIHWIKDHYAH